MFVTAALNLIVAQRGDMTAWAAFVAVFPPASKALLFAAQFLHIRRFIARRRREARLAEAAL